MSKVPEDFPVSSAQSAIAIEEVPIENQDLERGSAFFDFTDHHGFEKRIGFGGNFCNSNSRVFVSITELNFVGGRLIPVQGAASMEVHNVVPQDGNILTVRGFIGWERDLRVRLSVFVA